MTNNYRYLKAILILFFFLVTTNFLLAQIPSTISYQGVLTDQNDDLVPEWEL